MAATEHGSAASTSARLREAQADLTRVEAERDAAWAAHAAAMTALHASIETRARITDRALVLREQRDLARAELDSARIELERLRAHRCRTTIEGVTP
jgi:hypothetical protein